MIDLIAVWLVDRCSIDGLIDWFLIHRLICLLDGWRLFDRFVDHSIDWLVASTPSFDWSIDWLLAGYLGGFVRQIDLSIDRDDLWKWTGIDWFVPWLLDWLIYCPVSVQTVCLFLLAQIQMFLRFCTVLLKHGRSVVTIRLKTTRDKVSPCPRQVIYHSRHVAVWELYYSAAYGELWPAVTYPAVIIVIIETGIWAEPADAARWNQERLN